MSSDRTFSRRTILKGAAIGGGALLLDRVGLASNRRARVRRNPSVPVLHPRTRPVPPRGNCPPHQSAWPLRPLDLH